MTITLPCSNPMETFARIKLTAIDKNGKIENGRMLIPLPAVSEILDSEVNWDQNDRSITRSYVGNVNSCFIPILAPFTSMAPASRLMSQRESIKEQLMCPRFINHAFGGTIYWHNTMRHAESYLVTQHINPF
ncbi:stalk domain-containing protein [Bacillus sp. B15-48]|uniref:stalk domain-containing protein n=1 Tax=Bacillus sp. B15-48 TaxID=1548601 RepID=UPI0023B30E5E|nr:stalk domain-containing protein [Bacillus sp. B15-48]